MKRIILFWFALFLCGILPAAFDYVSNGKLVGIPLGLAWTTVVLVAFFALSIVATRSKGG